MFFFLGGGVLGAMSWEAFTIQAENSSTLTCSSRHRKILVANKSGLESGSLMFASLRASIADDAQHAIDVGDPFSELIVQFVPLLLGKIASESV